MEERKIRVAITHGDTNGIGYELIFKTFSDPEMLELCTPIIYGSPKVAAYHRKALDMEANFSIINKAEEAKDGRVNLLTAFDDEIKVEIGQPSKEAGHAALMALDRALTDYRDHLFDVLVTCPVDNDSIQGEGFDFKGQTAYIQECFSEDAKAMIIYENEAIRIGLMTDNVALKDVSANITKDKLTDKITAFALSLKRDFRISNPRIAVLSLNPKAGKEEEDIITPVINELSEKSINAFGPYPADKFFAEHLFDRFDGVLAMYHDQGIAPVKALYTLSNVEFTTGLPLVRTAPEQGVSFDLAGKGKADENSLRHAIYLAIDAWRNRKEYDEALANPSPKLYHEKRDESEKVRFSIPKKHENSIKEREE
jgi:4-hydroxythreonine-4-phosphate dehydrogenase